MLGGIDNPLGAVIGGFAVGVIENLGGAYVVGTELKLTMALIIIVAVLTIKPTGLLGRRVVQPGVTIMRTSWIIPLLVLLAVVLPIALFTDYHLFQLTMVVVYAIAILGLALLIGFNGQISLGHGAFYAIGAYTTAILMSSWNVPYWATLPVSAVICACVGFLIGLPALRLEGLYLALTTFALAVAMPQILKYKAFEDWTGGVQGLVIDKPEAPFGLKLSPDQWLYLFTAAIAIVLYVVAWNIVRGRIGRAMMAIRDHAMAAEAMGVNLPMVKTQTFALSAMYTGLAGSLGAIAVQFVAPDSFNVTVSIFLFVGLIVGGVSLDRRHVDRRGIHRVRAELGRPGVEGGAGGGIWRDPDRGHVPDAGRSRGVPACHVAAGVPRADRGADGS